MAFPGTYLGLTVELALGADLTAAPSTWAWTDVTSYVRAATGVSITRGAFDGGLQAPPSTCTFTVDNRDGRWVPTNPTGSWYGSLSKSTPVRVLVDEGTLSVRWTGFLSALPPRWDPSENNRYVPVTAYGIFQRMERRGRSPARPALYRTLFGAEATTTPTAYWPMDTPGALTEGTPAFKVADITGSASPDLSWVTDGSSSVLGEVFSTSGRDIYVRPTAVIGTDSTIVIDSAVRARPTQDTSAFTLSHRSGDFFLNVIANWVTGVPTLTMTSNGGTLDTAASTDATRVWDEAVHAFRVTLTQNGANVDVTVVLDGVEIMSGTATTVTLTDDGFLPGLISAARADVAWGPVVVWFDTAASVVDVHAAMLGYPGELAMVRAPRLGAEEDIPVDIPLIPTDDPDIFVVPATDIRMGVQTPAAFSDLLRECEAVVAGVLVEARDPTAEDAYLSLLTADNITNQDAALTLDHDSGHLNPPFEPTDDDRDLRNDWTASRPSGSSARVVADTGTLTPARIGTYSDSITVNVEADEQLLGQAGWRVNLGTVEGLRFPVVTLNLARNPSLIADWITCDIGSRITVTNPPAGIAPDDIELLVEGWTETLGPKQWTVQLVCSSYLPWHAFVAADDTGDTDEWLGRATGDPDAALRGSLTSGGTSMPFDPNSLRWTTTADDFPMDVRLGGEVVTVSGITTTAATFVAAGAASHADNAAVTPAIFAGAAANDLILVLAAIRSSGTGTLATPTGYTRLPLWDATDNVALFAKVHSGSESNPTVTPSGGSAGDTVSAFTFGFRNMPVSLTDLADVVLPGPSVTLNGSAANIAYGGAFSDQVAGAVNLITAWKQDDYTSVAVPSGFTEILEASTTTGSDQSLYAAYRIDTTPAGVASGSLAVTGGASAISRSAVCALAGGFQTMTASARAVNGVTKAHAAGTLIEVEDPGVPAI